MSRVELRIKLCVDNRPQCSQHDTLTAATRADLRLLKLRDGLDPSLLQIGSAEPEAAAARAAASWPAAVCDYVLPSLKRSGCRRLRSSRRQRQALVQPFMCHPASTEMLLESTTGSVARRGAQRESIIRPDPSRTSRYATSADSGPVSLHHSLIRASLSSDQAV